MKIKIKIKIRSACLKALIAVNIVAAEQRRKVPEAVLTDVQTHPTPTLVSHDVQTIYDINNPVDEGSGRESSQYKQKLVKKKMRTLNSETAHTL